MCLGTIGKIIKIENSNATLDVNGVSINVSLGLLKDPKIGELVMVHAGCAIQKMNQAEADEFDELAAEIVEVMKKR